MGADEREEVVGVLRVVAHGLLGRPDRVVGPVLIAEEHQRPHVVDPRVVGISADGALAPLPAPRSSAGGEVGHPEHGHAPGMTRLVPERLAEELDRLLGPVELEEGLGSMERVVGTHSS